MFLSVCIYICIYAIHNHIIHILSEYSSFYHVRLYIHIYIYIYANRKSLMWKFYHNFRHQHHQLTDVCVYIPAMSSSISVQSIIVLFFASILQNRLYENCVILKDFLWMTLFFFCLFTHLENDQPTRTQNTRIITEFTIRTIAKKWTQHTRI